MNAYYSHRGNRELGDVTWGNLGGTSGIRAAFARFLAALDPDVFGSVTGTVRVAIAMADSSVEEWPVDELDRRWTDRNYLIDAKLDLEPTVFAHDGESELVELTTLEPDEWLMDKVVISPRGERWAIVGHPAGGRG